MKRTISVLLCLCLLAALLPNLSFSASAVGTYGVDLACASYQTRINPFFAGGYGGDSVYGSGGQCTWYVWGRVHEKLGLTLPSYGNAKSWDYFAASNFTIGTTARTNSIMVAHYGTYGHILFVEKVENGFAYVTEANYKLPSQSVGYYHEDVVDLRTMTRVGGLAIPSVTFIYLDSHTHRWGSGRVTRQPTCTVSGVRTWTCTICGGEKTEAISPAGHSWGEPQISRAPTTAEAGSVGITCGFCGAKESADLPATEHSWTRVWISKAPTCAKAGTLGLQCGDCGLVQYQRLPKSEHSWEKSWVSKAPTCAATGTMGFQCSVCGEKKYEHIPALGHSWDSSWVSKAPTCTATGTMGFQCSVCGEKKYERIPALSHSWDSSWVSKAPTCKEGTMGYQCSVCGEKKYERIPAVCDHAWASVTLTKAPTASEAGKVRMVCAVCGLEKYSSPGVRKTGGVCGSGVSWTFCAGGYLLITGTGDMRHFSAEDPAPWRELAVKHVILCDGVGKLGNSAFRGITSLEKATLGATVRSVGEYAFDGCSALRTITLPVSVKKVGKYAFRGCEALSCVCVRDPSCALAYTDASTLGRPGKTLVCCFAGSTARAFAANFGFHISILPD